MKKFLLIIALFSLLESASFASSNSSKIDSILIQVDDYIDGVQGLRSFPSEDLLTYINGSNSALDNCKIYNALCWMYFNSDPPKAMEYAKLQYAIAKKINNHDALIASYDNIAWLYQGFSENEKAVSFMLKSLKAKETINDTLGISVSLSGLASTYYTMRNYELALDYYNQTYQIERNSNNWATESQTLANIGLCYVGLGKIDKGLETYFESVKLIKDNGDEKLARAIYSNIGLLYLEEKKDFTEALIYLNKSATLLEDGGDISLQSSVYANIAEVYTLLNDFNSALINGKKAVKYANLSGDKKDILRSNSILAKVYFQNKNYKLAYQHFNIAANIKDSIYDETSSSQIAEMQTKYNTEKKEAENNLLLAEKELDKAELEKKASQQKMLMLGLFLALIVVVYIAYNLNQKKKTNKLLNAQNEEISTKNDIIEEKNKDITDSINYAQRIQEAILPELSLLSQHYNSFIYYQPKDIVSGDFYWIKELGDKIYFSVVDCTGHGVPGAFMSIIGANSLNKIVEDLNIEKTGEILDELNVLVNKALGKKNTSEQDIISIRDGMDITICSIDRNTNILEYSGANNSLYFLRKPNTELIDREPILENDDNHFYEIKPNKMAIGGGDNEKKYETHMLQLEKDDTIYLFSDGYADQFGGPKGKKFMYKRFKQMFLTIQDQSMDHQLNHLETTMIEWKDDIEQLDDICVMGVRI